MWIPGQTATLGSDDHYPEEAPARQVAVAGFWMHTHQVTNAEFAQFISETGYVTVAERPLDAAAYPGAPADNLQAGSMVFHRTLAPSTCGTCRSGGRGLPAHAGTILAVRGLV